MGGKIVQYTDQQGNPVQGPVKHQWRYPVTMTVGLIAGLPAVLCLLAILFGGASISGKLLLTALVSCLWLVITGACMCFEADAKGYW